MSSTERLPEKPSLVQLRKQAKELRASGKHPTLAAAQKELARQYGFPSWPKLKLHVEQSELNQIIRDDNGEAARSLLESSPGLVNTPFPEGDTPLHRAAEWDAPNTIEALVKAGAQLQSKYADSAHSALSWALTSWSFQAARKLVEMGDEPDLFCAAGLGDLERVKAFWKDGKLVPQPSKTGSSRYSKTGERLPRPPADAQDQVSDALYLACRCNQPEVARWLLDHGADPNWQAYAGGSCLAWAEFSGNRALCDLLRERGGSDEVLDDVYKAKPRDFAMLVLAGWGFSSQRIRERLAADPSLISAQGETGTMLHAAAYGGHLEMVKLLLALGVDRDVRNVHGLTAAELAENRGFPEVAALLR